MKQTQCKAVAVAEDVVKLNCSHSFFPLFYMEICFCTWNSIFSTYWLTVLHQPLQLTALFEGVANSWEVGLLYFSTSHCRV